MNLALFIARRYLFSKSNRNAVNIITGISVVAISVVSMAMVMVLSGFNGMESLINSFFHKFDPDVKIQSADAKFFQWNDALETSLNEQEDIAVYTRVLEEKALMKSEDKHMIASLKGVDSNFVRVSDLEDHIFDGRFIESGKESPRLVLGYGIAQKLGLAVGDLQKVPEIWIPKVSKKTYLDTRNAFLHKNFLLQGVFSTGEKYDFEYGICDLKFAETLIDRKGYLSGIELKLRDAENESAVVEDLQEKLGDSFEVLGRIDQHPEVKRFIQMERLFIILIFFLILLIAIFNMIGSLTLLIIEKKKNIETLHAMGASLVKLKSIFAYEALLINGYGAVIGLGLGVLICFLQQKYQYITMATGAGAIAYPVEVRWGDLGLIFTLVLLIGTLTSYFAIRKIKLS